MGQQHGEQLKGSIRQFVEQRMEALTIYMQERGRLDLEGFLDRGRKCLDVAGRWDPGGTEELVAIARAAGVDAATLYAAGNMTDVRDVVLLDAQGSAADEGCSALLLPGTFARDGALHAAQTWDLNPTDIDFVVGVKREPTEGPQTWSITCVGCLSLVGMNSDGLSVGTTNIKVNDTRPGVGYLSIMHRALNSNSLPEACTAIRQAPRPAAHTNWVADAEQAI
jgi:hypothetical protein